MGLEQVPERAHRGVEPPRLRRIPGPGRLQDGEAARREQPRRDAVPCVGPRQHRFRGVPVDRVADREPVRHRGPQGGEVGRHGLGRRREALQRHDAIEPGDAADQRGREGEMRRRGVVVDRERQAGARHGGEMLEHLVLGQRRVGHGRQEPHGRAGIPRVLGEADRIVGPERADADQDRHAPAGLVERGTERPAPLLAREIGVGAGRAEQSDRVDARGDERRDEAPERRDVDTAIGAAGRDREGGQSLDGRHEGGPGGTVPSGPGSRSEARRQSEARLPRQGGPRVA